MRKLTVLLVSCIAAETLLGSAAVESGEKRSKRRAEATPSSLVAALPPEVPGLRIFEDVLLDGRTNWPVYTVRDTAGKVREACVLRVAITAKCARRTLHLHLKPVCRSVRTSPLACQLRVSATRA